MKINPRDVRVVSMKSDLDSTVSVVRLFVAQGVEGEQIVRASTVEAITVLAEIRDWAEVLIDSPANSNAAKYAVENLRRILGPNPMPRIEGETEDPERFDESTGPMGAN